MLPDGGTEKGDGRNGGTSKGDLGGGETRLSIHIEKNQKHPLDTPL